MSTQIQLEEEILNVLMEVDDPELIDVSVYDLGMVDSLVIDGSYVHVTMVPTFAGCPALDFIERDVKKAINELPWVSECEVKFSLDIQWNTDLITERGKTQLKKLGIAAPPEDYKHGEAWTVDCPYCSSSYTSMENVFGPTACRSILYCVDCSNPFEAMKPVLPEEEAVSLR